ncbi:MAG: DUF1993 domain-containing protein [Porticoccaceae bacterium]
MSLTMYSLTVPVLKKGINTLAGILTKAKAYCDGKQIDQSVVLNDRLFPDMFPLARQVQVACDQAKNAAAHFAGVEPPVFEDTETTIDQLLARIEKTSAYLDQLSAGQIDGSEARPVSFVVGGYKMAFPSGHVYLQNFVLPNFYFHLATAYDILRHNGVDLGKGDFLGDMGAEVSMA